MKSFTLATLIVSLAFTAHGEPIDPAAPKLTPPYRLMHGCKDLENFKPQPFWSDTKECERLWNDVFDRFNIVTGKTTNAALIKRLRARGIVFATRILWKNPNTGWNQR